MTAENSLVVCAECLFFVMFSVFAIISHLFSQFLHIAFLGPL